MNNFNNLDELQEYIDLLETAKERYEELISLQKSSKDIRFLSIEEVCQYIDCCDNTGKKLFNDPEFPSENYGRKKKVLASEFIKFFSVRRDKHNSAYWSN